MTTPSRGSVLLGITLSAVQSAGVGLQPNYPDDTVRTELARDLVMMLQPATVAITVLEREEARLGLSSERAMTSTP